MKYIITSLTLWLSHETESNHTEMSHCLVPYQYSLIHALKPRTYNKTPDDANNAK